MLQFSARMRDLLPVFPLVHFQWGVLVTEHEWRILRDQALRLRVGFADSRGGTLSFLPDRVLIVGYDTGRTTVGPPRWPVRTEVSWDGQWQTAYPEYAPNVHADLPLRLFLTRPPEAVLAADRIEYLRAAQEAGRPCHVLRLTVDHTIVPARSRRTTQAKPRSATWTLWIDRESALIWRAEAQERWAPSVRSRSGEKEEAAQEERVLEIRETYRNQVLDPEFTLEDFLPAPPDPVKPAEPLPGEKDRPREVPAPEKAPAQGQPPAQGPPPGEEARGASGGAQQAAPLRAAAAPWVPPTPMDRPARYLLLPLRVHLLQSEAPVFRSLGRARVLPHRPRIVPAQ